MKIESLFNKIYVLESLPEKHRKTGKALYEGELMYLNHQYPEVSSEHCSMSGSEELFKKLVDIEKEARLNGVYPIIHFECHGSEEGFQMADGTTVEWNKLRNKLLSINIACRLNLLITVGACNGAYLINTAKKINGVPFLAVVGTEGETKSGILEDRFGEFYSEFFRTLDGDSALSKLYLPEGHAPFNFYSATNLFAIAYKKYYQEQCRGKNKKKRVDELTAKLMQRPSVKSKGIKWARNAVKEKLANFDEGFDFIKSMFFFFDRYPENRSRFPITHADIVGVRNS